MLKGTFGLLMVYKWPLESGEMTRWVYLCATMQVFSVAFTCVVLPAACTRYVIDQGSKDAIDKYVCAGYFRSYHGARVLNQGKHPYQLNELGFGTRMLIS